MKYLLVPLLLLTGCSKPEPLPVYGQIPDFELTTQSGTPFHRKDLDGKIWVADFIYTTCTGPCPRADRDASRVQYASSAANTAHAGKRRRPDCRANGDSHASANC